MVVRAIILQISVSQKGFKSKDKPFLVWPNFKKINSTETFFATNSRVLYASATSCLLLSLLNIKINVYLVVCLENHKLFILARYAVTDPFLFSTTNLNLSLPLPSVLFGGLEGEGTTLKSHSNNYTTLKANI